MIIANATILNDRFEFQPADLEIEDGLIVRIAPKETAGQTGRAPNLSGPDRIDVQGDLVIPGLVDIHTHGAVGVDVMDKELDFAKWKNYLLSNGITTFYPATVTEDDETILHTLENLREADGVYLEGPYLCADRCGAHDKTKIRPVDLTFFDRIKDQISYMAIAPEVEGNMEAIKTVTAAGVRVTAAHSAADYQTAVKAFEAGATQLTHTFNAMNPLTHREPNLVGAALENEAVFCEVISDGVHLHPAVVKILYRILGVKRMVLISDSMAATGYRDGEYVLGGLHITVKDQIARTDYGAIAGSTTNLMGMVRKAISFGIPPADAIRMATQTPARAAGIDGKVGSIREGKCANLVWCSKDLTVRGVFKDGKKIG